MYLKTKVNNSHIISLIEFNEMFYDAESSSAFSHFVLSAKPFGWKGTDSLNVPTQANSVSAASDYGPDGRGSIPDRGRGFFL
jgi:hypothetical protein